MSIRRLIVPLIAIALLVGSVPVGKALGVWQLTGTTLGATPDGGSGASPVVAVEDIRGSSTLGQVSAAFDIPQEELYKLLGLPADIPPETRLKELESYNEVSVVRTKVAEYKASHP